MRRLLGVVLVLAACDKIPDRLPTGTEPQPFAVSLDVWSGSELTIRSRGLRGLADLPTVLLDGFALPTRRVDDTTLAAAIPDAPGAHQVRLAAAGFDQRSVIVYLRGFMGHVEGPELSGRTEPGRDPRYVFGSGPRSLRRWNVATNKAVDLGDTVHAVSCAHGIGPGPNLGEIVVLAGGCSGRWTVWHTEPLYPLGDTAGAAAATERLVAILAAGRSVVLGGAAVAVNACTAGTCTSESVPGTEGRDVVRSPRGDRAALLTRLVGDPGTPGSPVVDVALGTIAYRATALREAWGAAFSAAGDTLYLAGTTPAGRFALAALRAADGAALAARALDFAPCAVAVDPGGEWLYVAGLAESGQSRVQVFKRTSLHAVATLHVPAAAAFGQGSRLCHVIPNPIGHLLYVVDTQGGEHDPAARAQLFNFETPR
jgi:hypothetical protein